ncbi:MAG: 3-methyl-2-oxobutanoate hydroxymethyltransferase [Vampirovibrionales bacterium]
MTSHCTAPIRIPTLYRKKQAQEKVLAVTAYDFTTATLIEASGVVDVVLVGDSLAMSVLGHLDTLSVTLDEMILFARAVSRGISRCFVVGDLPFGSYHTSIEQGVESAVRFMKEGRVHAVKLEGATPFHIELIRRLVQQGIPVLAHVGFTPQWLHQLGGYRVQAREASQQEQLLSALHALEQAGAFGVVLEMVPSEVMAWLQEQTSLLTIGIGAGATTDGQILVLDDLVGRHDATFRYPRFSPPWVQTGVLIQATLQQYHAKVQAGLFPKREHTF